MAIRYISTRGIAPTLSFREAVLAGLASDGGLYLPDSVPAFSTAEMEALKNASYADLAYAVISRFIDEQSVAPDVLKKIIHESYATFRHPDVAPLKNIGDVHVLELFHGPTLAFKDFALQFLGRLLGHIFTTSNEHATVIGATSGDTGSAAIAGFAGRPNMDIFIMHPKGRVSDVQRKQMTTIADANVHNIAVDGTFDDCQDIVKALFNDVGFRSKHKLIAVNSINWARILAQVVYYFYAAFKLGAPKQAVSFTVPTGNFGDIYAGYIAKRMGLPIEKLIIATNKNDILARTLATGEYSMGGVCPTLSPSMDIQISSNFERLLFDLHGRDGAVIQQKMQQLRSAKKLTLSQKAFAEFKKEFAAGSADDAATLATIKDVYEKTGDLLDPHTAVGYAVALKQKIQTPMIVLATAHPAKFPDAVKKATGIHPELPAFLADLFSLPERSHPLPNDKKAVESFIESHTK
ncbi:MAG: threonine synthase [Alphaproteobacteria bacterium]